MRTPNPDGVFDPVVDNYGPGRFIRRSEHDRTRVGGALYRSIGSKAKGVKGASRTLYGTTGRVVTNGTVWDSPTLKPRDRIAKVQSPMATVPGHLPRKSGACKRYTMGMENGAFVIRNHGGQFVRLFKSEESARTQLTQLNKGARI